MGAESRNVASFAWNSSRYSSGTRPRSRNESIWPTFIAAPFMPPSTVTICSAVSIWRRSSALSERSCERTTFAALVPGLLDRDAGRRPADAREPLDAAGRELLVGHGRGILAAPG